MSLDAVQWLRSPGFKWKRPVGRFLDGTPNIDKSLDIVIYFVSFLSFDTNEPITELI